MNQGWVDSILKETLLLCRYEKKHLSEIKILQQSFAFHCSTDAERHDTSPLIGRSSPLIGHDWDSEAQLNVVMVLVTVMS